MGLVLDLLHLCAWAQLGVLTRVYLGHLFGAACGITGAGSGNLPCTTSSGMSHLGGAFFTDLPANVVGSFVMGVLAPGDLLAALYEKGSGAAGIPIPMLPRSSSLQSHPALLLGMRTGYCGSLTTFASWMLQMVQMMVGGHPAPLGTEWVSALWGIFAGTAVSMAALVAGQHVALLLWHTHQQAGCGKGSSDAASQTGLQKEERVHVSLSLEASHPSAIDAQAAESGRTDEDVGIPCGGRVIAGRSWLSWCADFVAVVTLCVLTGVSLAYAVHDERNNTVTYAFKPRSFIWYSILLGPSGCLLRWKLGLLNGKMPGAWSWFPMGTFLANQGACLLDYIVWVILLWTHLSMLQQSMLYGFVTGFSGCLSTVSTWVVEVQKLSLGIPYDCDGYTYMLISLVTAIVLGLVVYGTAVWTL